MYYEWRIPVDRKPYASMTRYFFVCRFMGIYGYHEGSLRHHRHFGAIDRNHARLLIDNLIETKLA